MRRVFGPRTIVEAAFLIAVPAIALALGVNWPGIIAASGVAYLLVLGLEATVWRDSGTERAAKPKKRKEPAPAPPPPVPAAEQAETVRVIPREPVAAAPPPPPPPPAPVEPEPVAVEPAPEPEPEPEPEPVVLTVVPAPEPELELVPEPEPEPVLAEVAVGAEVVPIGASAAPRRWNVWDLERLSRENAGADVARDEERTYLLMYLRDFADPGGSLPIDFDALVRDSFGDLVGR